MVIIVFIAAFFALHVAAEDGVILAVLGSTVVLDCKIPQTDTIIWDRPDGTTIAIKGVLHRSVNANRFGLQNNTLLQSLNIHNLMLQDDGLYRCYDLADAGKKQNFTVNIFVRPTLFAVKGPSTTVDEGSVQLLTCQIDGGKPPPLVRWHLLGPNTNGTTYSGHNLDTIHPNGTMSRVNTLQLKMTRAMYKGSIICDASIQYFYQVQQTVVLDVNLAPLPPSFDGFSGLFDDGDIITITCHSYGSRPAGKIYWMLNDTRINSTSSQIIKSTDDTYFVKGILTTRLTRNMENQILSCVVSNPVLQKTSIQQLTHSVVLLPNYAPSISADNGTRTVTEGTSFALHCLIEARPLPPQSQKIWFLNGSPIVESNFNITRVNLSVSTLSTSVHVQHFHRDQNGQYSCQGYNHLGAAKSPVMSVQALYNPVCSFTGVQKHAVRIGGSVSLTCRVTANPNNVTMRWQYIQRNAPIKTGLLGDVESQTTSSTTIRIDVASNRQYSDIACIATNMIGDMLFPCRYRIVEPSPPEIPVNCSTTALSDTEIQMKCMPGFNGGSPQHFLLQMFDGSNKLGGFNTISNQSSPMFTVASLTPQSNYTFRMCSGSSAFARTISCGGPLLVSTLATRMIDKKRMSSPTQANTTPYIVGGVLGFLVLVVLISVIVYCLHKKRKRGGNPLHSDQIPWKANDWRSKGDDNKPSVSVISEVQNHAFVEDATHSEKNAKESEEQLQESIYGINNEKLRNLEERASIKLSKAKALTLLALSKEHQATECGIKIDNIDFGFLDDQVTDLDELSNPRSPGLMLDSGSPRHEFPNNEADLDFHITDNKMQRSDSQPHLNTNTKYKSRSTQSLTELVSSSVGNTHDYINMSYSNEAGNRTSALKEVKDDLKKTFISKYTLEFQTKEENDLLKNQNSPSSSTSNISGMGSYGGAPRRQSYTLAISSDEEGNTMVRDVLSVSINKSSPIYDVPRNSGGFDTDFDSDTANTKDMADCKSLNSYQNPDKEISTSLSPENNSSEKRNHKFGLKDSSLLNSESSSGRQITANKETGNGDENSEFVAQETGENFARKSSPETNLNNALSFGAYF